VFIVYQGGLLGCINVPVGACRSCRHHKSLAKLLVLSKCRNIQNSLDIGMMHAQNVSGILENSVPSSDVDDVHSRRTSRSGHLVPQVPAIECHHDQYTLYSQEKVVGMRTAHLRRMPQPAGLVVNEEKRGCCAYGPVVS
jgi:hypothetical protein